MLQIIAKVEYLIQKLKESQIENEFLVNFIKKKVSLLLYLMQFLVSNFLYKH